MDPENPGDKINTISIVVLNTLIVCDRMGTYLYSLVGVCLIKLDTVGADGSISSQRSDSVVKSVAKVIIDQGDHEMYLLATLEHSG